MNLLLDENLPKKFRWDFPGHEVHTVRNMDWQTKKNGELLALMLQKGFAGLLTFDQNLEHQQNFSKYPISVFVLHASDNTYLTLEKLVPKIIKALEAGLSPGVTHIHEV